jgi:hypothetical protein
MFVDELQIRKDMKILKSCHRGIVLDEYMWERKRVHVKFVSLDKWLQIVLELSMFSVFYSLCIWGE